MPDTEAPLPGKDDVAAYAYWDGSQRRIVDPIEAGTVLESELPDYADWLAILAREIPAALLAKLPAGSPINAELRTQDIEAKDKLLGVARKMFGLQPLTLNASGKTVGLGRKGTMDVLMGYFEHMGGLAREARPFVNSPVLDTPSTPPDSPTEPSVGSGGAAA